MAGCKLASVYIAITVAALAPSFCHAYCPTGNIRLVGGRDRYEGRVEMCFSNVWGTVCDHSWDAYDAKVVCRQLGLPHTSTTPYYNAYFGKGDGPLLFDHAQCSGYENRLEYCESGNLSSCDYSHAAGVRCGACSPSQWHCNNGDCVLSLRRCDGYWDCSDGSDEWNCEGVTQSPDRPCSLNQWRCDSGECSTRCDGLRMCSDGGDERNCYSQCSGFECSNGDCVRSTSHCDGTRDCSDASDETGCVNYGLIIGVSLCAVVVFAFLCVAAILIFGQKTCQSSSTPISQPYSRMRHHQPTPRTVTTNIERAPGDTTGCFPVSDVPMQSFPPPPYSEVDLFKTNCNNNREEPSPSGFDIEHESLTCVGNTNSSGSEHQIESCSENHPTEGHR